MFPCLFSSLLGKLQSSNDRWRVDTTDRQIFSSAAFFQYPMPRPSEFLLRIPVYIVQNEHIQSLHSFCFPRYKNFMVKPLRQTSMYSPNPQHSTPRWFFSESTFTLER